MHHQGQALAISICVIATNPDSGGVISSASLKRLQRALQPSIQLKFKPWVKLQLATFHKEFGENTPSTMCTFKII